MKLKKSKVREEVLSIKDTGMSFKDFKTALEQAIRNVPNGENEESLRVETESKEQYYDYDPNTYHEAYFKVYYDRLETDAEFKARQAQLELAERDSKQRDLAQLEALKKRLGIE